MHCSRQCVKPFPMCVISFSQEPSEVGAGILNCSYEGVRHRDIEWFSQPGFKANILALEPLSAPTLLCFSPHGHRWPCLGLLVTTHGFLLVHTMCHQHYWILYLSWSTTAQVLVQPSSSSPHHDEIFARIWCRNLGGKFMMWTGYVS